MIVHKDLTNARWFKLSFVEQMANIGCDLDRAIRWQQKDDLENSTKAFNRTLELLQFTIIDPKNKFNSKELTRVRNALLNYFMDNNKCSSTDKSWYKYFMNYNYVYALERGK